MIKIILAILQARMSSSRFPGKVMKPILGEPMLYRQIERIMRASEIDDLIVATSNSEDDDIIEKLCFDKNIKCYRGSLDDVLDRFYGAAMTCSPDYVMRLTGDCPLFDPKLADNLIDFFISGHYDYASNTVEPTYPDGLDMEIMKLSSLKYASEKASLLYEREHVTPYILNNPDKFKIGCMKNPDDLSSMRWTVDEPEDYIFVKSVYESLYPDNPEFTWGDVLSFIEGNPQAARINSSFRRNEGYEKSLIKQAKSERIDLDRVYLKILKPDDVTEKYCGWLNNSDTTRHLVTKSTDMAGLREYVNGKYLSRNALFYGMYSYEDAHIGNVKLEPVDFSKKETTLGILIGDKDWRGRGICKEVCRGLSEYVFSFFKFERIWLGVEEDNKAAMKCYKSCGFREPNSVEDNSASECEKKCIVLVLEKMC